MESKGCCLLSCFLALLCVSNCQINNTLSCGLRQNADECVQDSPNCGWCGAAYSCTFASSNTCPSVCAFCDSNETCASLEAFYVDAIPPPRKYDYFCRNGGVKLYTNDFPNPDSFPNQRFGGNRCVCPSEWIGHDCSVCKSDTSCTSSLDPQDGDICNFGWIPTEAVPLRELLCFCTSSICSDLLDAGEEEASISLEFQYLGANDFAANFSIDKRVPFPDDRFKETGKKTRQSTVLLGANLAECRAERNLNCRNSQGSGPWSGSDRCSILSCDFIEFTCPDNTTVDGDSYAFHIEVCSSPLIRSFLNPPFYLACIEENDGTIKSSKSCSFATSDLSHGSFTLDCESGKCASVDDPQIPPSEPNVCGILNLDLTACNTVKYIGIYLGSTLLGLLILITFFTFDKLQQNDLHKVFTNGSSDLQPALSLIPQNERLSTKDAESYLYLVFNNIEFLIQSKPGIAKSLIGRSRKVERKILNGISGYFGGSELCAVLGPSGSGKTSLIDILAGRKNSGRITGEIALGGEYATRSLLKQNVGYVLQDDVLPGTLTVVEYLLFHANLRMERNTLVERIQSVESIVTEMSLVTCANTLIGDAYRKGISGGEKRRASIACELLADRRIILLDEPTSGLDSASSQQVVKSLKRIIRDGISVATTIHQPSSRLFKEFDRVMLLSKNGYLMYSGSTEAFEAYLVSIGFDLPNYFNPAEFALDIAVQGTETIQKCVLGYYESKYREKEDQKCNEFARIVPKDENEEEYINEIPLPLFRKQFRYLATRFTANAIRHPILPLVHVVATILVALIATLLYLNIRPDLGGAINRAGFFFFIQTYLTLSALADLGVWQEERLIFIRESTAGLYQGEAYLLSKFICEIFPLRLLPVTFASVILVFGIGLQSSPAEKVGIFLLVLVFIGLISTMMFLFIGMVFRSNGIANFVAVVSALFCLLMSGFLLIDFGFFVGDEGSSQAVVDSGVNYFAAILGFLSYLRPAFEILMVNELSGLVFSIELVDPGGNGQLITDASIPASGDLLLAQLNLNSSDIQRDFIILAFWLIFFTACVL